MGSWQTLETVYALRLLSPTTALGFGIQYANFAINGGCKKFYKGMANYINQNNIWTETIINKIERPQAGEDQNWMRLRGTRCGERVKAKCGKLVVAFPQTPANLDFMDLDLQEELFFSTVQNRYYGGGRINLYGPLRTNTGNNYTLVQINVTNAPPNETKFVVQGLTAVQTQLTYAPASFYAFSDTPVTRDQLQTIVESQLDRFPSYLITNYTIVEDLFLHEYYPRPNNASLLDPVGFYTKLEQMQGRRDTYWVGTLHAGLAAHHSIMEKTFRLVNEHF
jgi:hypothetical protein